jgi:hypothetical protein
LCVVEQMRGHKVAIVERNEVKGRDQEWNISRHEVQVLPADSEVHMHADAEYATAS